jgi:hypothetical protein
VLKRHVGGPDSEIARTLATLVGRDSELVRRLDPSSADGILRALAETLEEQLRTQRKPSFPSTTRRGRSLAC